MTLSGQACFKPPFKTKSRLSFRVCPPPEGAKQAGIQQMCAGVTLSVVKYWKIPAALSPTKALHHPPPGLSHAPAFQQLKASTVQDSPLAHSPAHAIRGGHTGG